MACRSQVVRVVLSLLVLVAGGALGAQPAASAWFRRTVDRDQGLPETQVNAVAQTPDGYLWLGTRRGIVRYDGLSFTPYTPEDHPALSSYWINGLTVDGRGRLWIATDKGIAFMERGVFHAVPHGQVPQERAWKAVEHDGEIWVASSKGAFRGDGEQFQPVPGVDTYLYAVQADAVGRLWFAGRGFLGYWDGTRVHTADLPREAGVARTDYLDLVADAEGGVWAGTRTGAVHVRLRPDGSAEVAARVSTTVRGTRGAVFAITRSADGLVWLATASHGVMTWDGTRLQQTVPNSTEQAWAFLTDRRGRLWVGTGSGLERYQRSAFTTLGDGLAPTPSTWSIRRDLRGDLWTATISGAVYRLRGGRHVEALPPVRTQAAPATWPMRDGGILVAREGRQILHLTREGTRDLSARFQLPPTDVLGMYEDPWRSTWFVTDSGVYRSAGGRALPVSRDLGLALDEAPRYLHVDSSGRVLIGRPGLTVIGREGRRHYGPAQGLTDSEVLAVLPHGNAVWIGTADSGLFVLRRDTVVALGHVDPRLHREVLGLAADDLGHLWLASSFGLSRAGVDDLLAAADGRSSSARVRSFDRNDGLPTTELNGDFQSVIQKDTDGVLWLPTYRGVVRVDPRAIHSDTTPPQVHLERLVVDGRELPLASRLDLPPNVSRLEVTFAVTDALVPSRVNVEYRMVGIADTWVSAGNRRTLSFGLLRGGRYGLHIRAANEDGGWGKVLGVLEVRVAHAYYQQPWFVPGLVALGMALVLAAARARQVRLVRRGRELAAEVQARTADLEAARATLERRVDERTAELAGELAERKRLERQLVEAQKLESIGRLAGGVAHEINNSMTAVLSFTELAEQGATEQPALLRDLREIRGAGERVAGITRQLLTFARRQVSQRGRVDLARLIRRMERSLQQMVGESATVALASPDALPPVTADVTQLEQVVINLVLNARDAMPGGGTIHLTLAHEVLVAARTEGGVELAPGAWVHLSVRDEGVGMSDEVLARLFEPFFTTKDLHKGTGLGLAVCHGIVTQHGGAISATSRPGEGSTFHVWLPVATATSPDQEADELDARDGEALSGHETVLVVEDEPAVRAVACRALTRHGYHVLEAPDGAAALSLLDQRPDLVDLVLTDVVMPEVDGLTLARELRSRGRETPIVFMSGFTGAEGHVEEAISHLGPLMVKPFTHDALATAVRRELDRETRRRAVPGRYQPG